MCPPRGTLALSADAGEVWAVKNSIPFTETFILLAIQNFTKF
jgi:hypothetical protein